MKAELPARDDADFVSTASALAATKGQRGITIDASEDGPAELAEIFFNYAETIASLNAIAQDGSLSAMVCATNPNGYDVFKDANSLVGVTLASLSSFATTELRMQGIANFLEERFPNPVLRERQDTKVRYELSSDGVKLSQVFSSIEENKQVLHLADYGVSQTSLEQVFNHHAEEAERLKQGRDDR